MHENLPTEVVSKMVRPRSESPASKKKGYGKGDASPKASAPKGLYCMYYLKGSCSYGDKCKFPHKSQKEVDEIKAQGSGGAKATPKPAPAQ